MKRALITGSGGFLGGYLLSMLRDEMYDVVELRSPQAFSAESNIFYSIEALRAQHTSFDVIFHLAAFIPYGAMNQPDERLHRVNVDLTNELLTAFPNARFIYASSVAVFGSDAQQPLTMQSAPKNVDLYGLSKTAAEELVRQTRAFAIVRFSSIIGPGMKPVSMIPKMVNQAKTEHRIAVYGDGSRLQNYLDVRDAAQLLTLVAKSTENIMMLGVAPREYSNAQVATIIADLTGASLAFEGTDTAVGFRYDDRTMHQHIGFKTKFGLTETIRDIIAS